MVETIENGKIPPRLLNKKCQDVTLRSNFELRLQEAESHRCILK